MGTHYDGSQDDRHILDAFIKLTRASETVNNSLNEQLTQAGLTPSQFGALEAIFHLGPMNQKTIAEKLLKTGGNITVVIENLEKRDLVERDRDPSDRRAMLVSLRMKGRQLIESLFPEHLGRIRTIFDALSDDEITQLGRICKKLGTQAALPADQ